ncbi:hypothetical protein GYH30_051767 [Glycine max]|nr:hypothetical protein GYH30_051767 [Glycine max]
MMGMVMVMVMFCSAKSLNLSSSGNTSLARSSLSFRLSSAHLTAIFARHKACSRGQSVIDRSSICTKLSFSIDSSAW